MTQPAERACRGIEATAAATERLLSVVGNLDDTVVRGPSLLPGWSRRHVLAHLARNADALTNLLTWARTGVEHPMYTSREDRDAAIELGAARGYLVITEDLGAASARFAAAAEALPEAAWSASLTTAQGKRIAAWEVPWFRMREVWLHLVDLDAGVGYDALPVDVLERLLDDVTAEFDGRPGVPPLAVDVTLPDGRGRTWPVNAGGAQDPPTVAGDAAAVLGWLTGRGDGAGLRGELPALPAWA